MNPDNSDNFEDDESEDSEFENHGNKGKDFEAERDRFVDWVYNNESLLDLALQRRGPQKVFKVEHFQIEGPH